MAGHGEKYSRKQEDAIIALLTKPTIPEAAVAVGIGESTLWRWMKDPDFNERYREARCKAFQQAINQLQQASGEAVQTLREVAADSQAPASSRVSAAKSILELAIKSVEMEEIVERVKKIEEAINKGGCLSVAN